MSIDRLLMLCGTLALAGSSLTYLRFPEVPMGVPEVLGLIFIVGSMVRSRRLFPAFAQMLAFGALLLLGVLIGSINNLFIGAPSINLNQDMAAVAYSAALALFYANALLDRPPAILWLGRALAVVLCLHALPLVTDLVGIDIGTRGWSGEVVDAPDALEAEDRFGRIKGAEALQDKSDRYQGLTTNPNQLALAGGICAILFPWLALSIRQSVSPFWWLFGLLSIVMVAMTKSSTAILGVGLGWVLILVRHLAATEDERGVAHYPLVWLVATWTLLTPALLILWRFLDRAVAGPNGSGEASGRFALWRNSWDGFVQSHFLGVGPGAHAGLSGPFQQEEAHNIWVDLALQGGVISLAALALLLWFVFRRTVSGHSRVGVVMFSFFVVMGMAHYLLRHPLYWALICLPAAINHYYSRPARLWRQEQRLQRQQARQEAAVGLRPVQHPSLAHAEPAELAESAMPGRPAAT